MYDFNWLKSLINILDCVRTRKFIDVFPIVAKTFANYAVGHRSITEALTQLFSMIPSTILEDSPRK